MKISPTNVVSKEAGEVILPIYCIRHIFREGFIFANFASRVLLANSTTRENKFTSDPDARMLFVYTQLLVVQYIVHVQMSDMILISPTSVHDCSPPQSRI